MKIERVVVDTNVLISAALLEESIPARARNRAVRHGQLIGSDETVREFVDKLVAAKFDVYVSRETRDVLVRRYLAIVDIVPVVQVIRACRDHREDKFLEVAVNGRADVIITGNKDLLALHPFRGITIVSPADYLTRVVQDAE